MKNSIYHVFAKIALVFVCIANLSLRADELVFKIKNQTYSLKDIQKEDSYEFYKIEKDKYDLIEKIAREKYLEFFWENKAKSEGVSVATAQKNYFDKNIKISDAEVNSIIERFKDHPQFKTLSKQDQIEQVRAYLYDKQKQELLDGIINSGMKNNELVILYPKPQEPIFNISISFSDHIRYGPSPDDIKPLCYSNCPITVVEFSDFECPFCARALATTNKILSEYKGKIRWVMKDFPLSFHDRARPAAIAAHCAGEQKKYWHMYFKLFENQSQLSDTHLEKYAKDIKGLNIEKWQNCYNNKKDAMNKIIDKNLEMGIKLGVSGTPAYFINGRRIAGALPYEHFKSIIDEELSKNIKK